MDDLAIVGRSVGALDRVLTIATALHTAAALDASAEYKRDAGYTDDSDRNARASQTILNTIGSPSVARVRAAYVLLAGVTDSTLASVIRPDALRLRDVLDKVDSGKL